MGTETQAFDAIVADIETPMYVVTTAAGAERGGCLVGFASQCSIEPPRFCVWLSKLNHTYHLAQSAATLVVHLLRHGDQDLARRFGSETGDEVDKFTDIAWHAGPGGCPVIPRCDWFAGTIVDPYRDRRPRRIRARPVGRGVQATRHRSVPSYAG